MKVATLLKVIRRRRNREQRAETGVPSRFFMKEALSILAVMLFFAATVPAFGGSPKIAGNFCRQNPEAVATSVNPEEGGLALTRRSAQSWQVISTHGVWYTPKVYLEFYADADLVAYLAGISDLLVLPVYSPSPFHFRYGEVVLVSTGFILESPSEGELFEAIARDGGCPMAPPDAARFSAVQAKLALGLAQYSEAIKPQLRCREVIRLQLRRRE